MFEAEIIAGFLKKVVESVKDLVPYASFDFSETAIGFQTMDSSNVAIISLQLASAHFDNYRCNRACNLGLSLADLYEALDGANYDDRCILKVGSNDGDLRFVLTFVDPCSEETRDVTLKTIDIENEMLGIPEQDYSVICLMPAAEFQKTCNNLAIFSDTLNITATTENPQIVFTAKGDSDSPVVTYSPSDNCDDESQAVSLEVNDPVNVNFSIEYMNQFAKAALLSRRVRLSLSNDAPAVFKYRIEEKSFLKFHLAPKIDDDDGENDY